MLRARREQADGGLHEPSTEHLSDEAQRRQDVREVLADLAALPEDQRAALVLAEIGAVSHEEIAQVLGVPRQKVKALVFQARTSLAASRRARETPCAEIRTQLANLRGGALRRTTLHRHLRQCPGCQAFREEVALQRKTLAVALPVIATPGLKEAALGAAFGSAGAGGGTAAGAGGAAVAAKALVAVALVGGGTTAGVEAVRHPSPPAPVEAAPAPASGVGGLKAVLGPAQMHLAPATHPSRTQTAPATRPAARRGHAPPPKPAHRRKRTRRGHANKAREPGGQQHGAGAPPHAAKDKPPKVKPPKGAKPVPPGQVKPAGKRIPPGQAKRAGKPVPPGQAKKAPSAAKPVRPGRTAAPPGQAKPKPVPPGHGKQPPLARRVEQLLSLPTQ
jgi:hypothetical protein